MNLFIKKLVHLVHGQKSVSFDPTAVQSFPTEQANRQKERRKAGISVRKRKHIVEQHQDDVGDDLSSIKVTEADVAEFATVQLQEESLTNWEHAIFQFMSEVVFQQDSQNATASVSLETLVKHVDAFYQANPRRIHVCEMFGGEDQTSRLCAKLFGLQSGVNFEIKYGFNLNNTVDKQDLINYLNKYKPDVVVMAPPCKGFGPWVHLNKVIHPDAVKAAKMEGIPLAKLCAQVAEIQLSSNRRFILEQPRSSTMFDLKEWQLLEPRLHSVICDQCRFGLVN